MLPYSRTDWLHLLVSPRGSLTPGVAKRVLFFGLLALAVWAVYRVHPRILLPLGMHEVAGAVVALVLAFRTNTAYARFWEGRTLWGAIVNSSRNVTRLIDQYASAPESEKRALATWVVAFAHSSRRSLRAESPAPELRELLPEGEVDPMLEHRHPPLHAAARVSELIAGMVRRGQLDANIASRAEQQVSILVDCLGGCERIHKTPTPLGYVLLLQRILVLLLASLPFAIVDNLGRLTPLITVMVAYPVLLIEALGRELDDPFGHDANDLPLTRICDTIERNLLGSSSLEAIMESTGTGTKED